MLSWTTLLIVAWLASAVIPIVRIESRSLMRFMKAISLWSFQRNKAEVRLDCGLLCETHRAYKASMMPPPRR